MRTYQVSLRSVTPYSQSRYHESPKLDNELPDAYDKRTCREHLHYDPATGEVFIPPMAIRNSLSEAAQFLSMRVPGKGQATYTKHFLAGVMLMEPVKLGIHKDGIPIEALFLPTDGVRGGGKRAIRRFPRIDSWTATCDILVVDETISEEVLKHHIIQAGLLIGIGRFRPRNGGFYGRYELVSMKEVAS